MIASINNEVRRRYILGKQGLWPGRRWEGKEGTAQAIRTIEAVQVDPVSVVAESHDIVLWGRVDGYLPDLLDSLLYQEHEFFDYGGGLFLYPMEELPYWRVMMARYQSEKRWADFARDHLAVINRVRREIHERGPLMNRDLEGETVAHYRASKDTGVALYYLWLTGELMSHSRQGKERVYDFLEKVAPPHLQWIAPEEEAIRFFTHKEIDMHGLVSERDFRHILRSVYNRLVDAQAARTKLAEMVEAGELGCLTLGEEKERLYYLAADTSLLEQLAEGQVPPDWRPLDMTTTDEVVFLSPLEYVSARGRAKTLFNFDYTWEIYKPAPSRKYGPYTMPVLYGDRLVARMDARLDRQASTLVVNGLWLEKWFHTDEAFERAFARGLKRFKDFLGAERVDGIEIHPV